MRGPEVGPANLFVGRDLEVHHRVHESLLDAELEFRRSQFVVRQFFLIHGEDASAFHFSAVVIDGDVMHFDLDVSHLFLDA